VKKGMRAFLLYFKKCITNDLITVYAAQASFYIIIALIPFLMLAMSLLQFIVPVDFEEVIMALNKMLPENMHDLAYRILSELSTKSTGFLSFSAITALWTTSRGAASLQSGVRKIYKSTREKGFILTRWLSIVHTLVFVIIFVAALILLVFGSTITDILSKYFGLALIITLFENLRGLIAVLTFTLFFALMYKFFAGKKVPFKNQLPGAAFSALGWVFFSLVFGLYINSFADYSYIYGSLTALILFSLWLYGCMIIFLLGAEINVLVQILIKEKSK